MKYIEITRNLLTEGTKVLSEEGRGGIYSLPAIGGGFDLSQIIQGTERYLIFNIEILEEHSVAMNMLFYSMDDPDGKPAFNLRFGLMPNMLTLISIDLNWMDAHVLFPENNEGQLKVVCHGRRMERSEIDHIVLSNYPCYHDIKVRVTDITLTPDKPEIYPLPDRKLIDEMGQLKNKQWRNKFADIEQMKDCLRSLAESTSDDYGVKDWNAYGGWTKKKLAEGSGYFSKIKKEGRWWLVDPLGYAFFSMGPDCVAARADCRVDGLEKLLDWLPERSDAEYAGMFDDTIRRRMDKPRRSPLLFSFEQANLYKTFGKYWYDKWAQLVVGRLKNIGMNTLGNWSDLNVLDKIQTPYVATLDKFPSTSRLIFRDFPDVFSDEYTMNARVTASQLKTRSEDPYRIGYFLGNEPSWAFVDNLVIADEVLLNPNRTASKEKLISYLKDKYQDISSLNAAWERSFECFDELYEPQKKASGWSKISCEDMRAFSRVLLDRYIAIPSAACREQAPNHMNLGLRWAWISDPDVVTGWQYFDVFSINSYAVDPTSALDHVQSLGVDLPVMIGEFHFGALDAGLTATGLEAVESQTERGVAYRYYVDRVAAHPSGVGCHYFQCYDQFALGRFDGENYNIGLFDICSRPYEEMMAHIRQCSEAVYEVAEGKRMPSGRKPKTIPMIAY